LSLGNFTSGLKTDVDFSSITNDEKKIFSNTLNKGLHAPMEKLRI
tara:strand:- start:24680 stop:24814 length:135 start_codon:yes stop_codon:yes gene_type:complete